MNQAVPPEFIFDHAREQRTQVPEAVFCAGKSAMQIQQLLAETEARAGRLLLTRLEPGLYQQLRAELDYDSVSRTAFYGQCLNPAGPAKIAVVTAGTSDVPIAREATRSLQFFGLSSDEYFDVGVAGLWRLMEKAEVLRRYPVLIAIAGMEGALFSVIAGLVPGLVIAVPSSCGYGVTAGGKIALSAALGSCAPGVLATNIDNGFGAACAARKMMAFLQQQTTDYKADNQRVEQAR